MSQSEVLVDVLIPTRDRESALAITLTALAAQTLKPLRIIISDQSESSPVFARPELVGLLRFLRHTGYLVDTHHHLPARGMAEQRAFLLAQAQAPCCLFLDDDVITEPNLIERMHTVLRREACGFVGSALHGLSFLGDRRPDQQRIQFWDNSVKPERIHPESQQWTRHHLHSAANLMHLQQQLSVTQTSTDTCTYKVAWVGGCVMFDTSKLRACNGFDFWTELPSQHCGEDVLAQLRVMARFGGCAILPSGAYHLELPTRVPVREPNAPMALRHWLPE